MIDSLYKTFRHYSERGSIWIISDTHFDDPDCLLMDDHWPTPDQHIKNLIKYCHSNDDTIIHLGDVGDPTYMEKIRGYKILLLGNNDKGKEYYKNWFDEIYDGPLFIGSKILLSHEPIQNLGFCMNIHGYDHLHMEKDCYHKNCASNIVNYMPINLGKEIKNGLLSKALGIHKYYESYFYSRGLLTKHMNM